jgi:hypothetical protein
MIRNTYTRETQYEVIARLLKYANQTMDSHMSNPNITKREAIMLADAFLELYNDQQKMVRELLEIYRFFNTDSHKKGRRLEKLIEKVTKRPIEELIK